MPTQSTNPRDSSLLSGLIAGELAAARKECSTFSAQPEPRGLQQVVLIFCFLANIVLFLLRADYIILFIAASFYLNMFYFLTLLVPTSPGAVSLQKPEIARFHTWLWENGIRSGTRQFTRIFVNAFFMNCRTLTFPLGLLFSIDIVFTLITAYTGHLPGDTALFVIAQSAIIIMFYALIWKVEPFTEGFAQNLDRFKSRLSRDLPPAIISLLFLTGFLAVVFLFLTSIILLPGITLNTFLTESGLRELAHLVSLLAILAISQYFIVRTLHGQRSRVMAGRLVQYRLLLLESLARDIAGGRGDTGDIESRYEMTSRLLESRIYRITRNSLAGAFPVYVVDPDFSVMMDTTTLTAIKGYLREDRPG
ncbi:hypothetical protein [Methanoregula sp.]|uniref:hypothetical protein n=1 Tax=Methanoregula sp. TaxID=2052170 RepID=UPI002636DEF5|nr:hypothetical protein [Methanoregula sp.]MDD5141985.1 hypothetical protein [Methanoregula sp.]